MTQVERRAAILKTMRLPDYIFHNGEGGLIVTNTIAYIVLRPITEPVLLVSSLVAACLKQGSTPDTTLSLGLTANKERSDSPKALYVLFYKTCLESKEERNEPLLSFSNSA